MDGDEKRETGRKTGREGARERETARAHPASRVRDGGSDAAKTRLRKPLHPNSLGHWAADSSKDGHLFSAAGQTPLLETAEPSSARLGSVQQLAWPHRGKKDCEWNKARHSGEAEGRRDNDNLLRQQCRKTLANPCVFSTGVHRVSGNVTE